MTVAARRGAREQAPQVPSGRIVLQPPPEITPSDGASGLLLQAVPMVGSLGTIGFVAMSQSGAAGLVHRRHVPARLGRLRARQRGAPAPAAHRRRARRPAASTSPTSPRCAAPSGTPPARQREAALWNYPDPAALPTIAAEGTPGVGAHRLATPTSCRCGSGATLPAAVPHPRAPGDAAAGPARPGRGVGAAPPPLDPPGAARAAGIRPRCARGPASR